MPFCSERCRYLDLGHWLEEGIGVPVESGENSNVEEDPSQRDDSPSGW
jgi:endogenous inhibitor of DNA gyrase (YacG/DUF329 family)